MAEKLRRWLFWKIYLFKWRRMYKMWDIIQTKGDFWKHVQNVGLYSNQRRGSGCMEIEFMKVDFQGYNAGILKMYFILIKEILRFLSNSEFFCFCREYNPEKLRFFHLNTIIQLLFCHSQGYAEGLIVYLAFLVSPNC